MTEKQEEKQVAELTKVEGKAPKVQLQRYWQPAEWTKHESCWLAWPSHPELWAENLDEARKEFTDLCRAIADLDLQTGEVRGEKLEVLVLPKNEESKSTAQAALAGLPVTFHEMAFGDIWLRDTAPIFIRDRQGQIFPQRFKFNGWGNKHLLPFDDQLSYNIAFKLLKSSIVLGAAFHPAVLEGGAVEVDGEGTGMTNKQCLLATNRNSTMKQQDMEEILKERLGIYKIIWVEGALVNDHTDGHIDTLARFSSAGNVICMEPRTEDDPNAEVLRNIIRQLEQEQDFKGNNLNVIRIPSPGKVLDSLGQVMPASYLNYYIANSTVIVPTYSTPFDDEAVAAISQCFPERKCVGLPAKAILTGGGAFHCITQQQPVNIERRKIC